MAWENMTAKDLHYWSTGGGYNMCRASVQGVTFFKSNRIYNEVELPHTNAFAKKITKTTDARTTSNKSRTGGSITRNGNCVRTGEIRKRIHSWCGSIGGAKRIRFFTITFPSGTRDEDGKRALNIWLTRLRKAEPRINYFWTAERQQNGTIHFHLLLDRHMSIQMVNGWMKSTLINMGDLIPWSNENHASIYGGVNVKQKIYSGHGVEKYLIKYLTKSSFTGISQPWHASRALGKLAIRVRKPSSVMLKVLHDAYVAARRRFNTIRLFWENGILYVPFPDGFNSQVSQWLEDHNGWKNGGNFQKQHYHSPAIVADQSWADSLQSVAITDIEKLTQQTQQNFLSIFQQQYQTRK